jgi:hypothetical protein
MQQQRLHWLGYDPVAFAVLAIGMGMIALLALSRAARAAALMDCDGDGLPVFERLRGRRHDRYVFLYAFDLLELDGRDLRRDDD